VAVANVLGEAPNAVGVVPFHAEVVAGDEPVGALAGAGCLDVGGLLVGLPAAGHDQRARDGRTLGAVDVLPVVLHGFGEPAVPVCVGHAGLVEVDRGVLADVELAAFDTRDERVERQGPAGERGTVLAEALGG
jgi:hypothetical protein